ncbi:MAG: hypothetical protein GX301_01745 [Gracilibacteraceae bacterium]|nr:hypothetical protein [Gracilibacteraceae bacterium]
METVQFQSYVFLYSLYGGIIIGVLYDIYRVIRGIKKSERFITSLWDILFLFSVFMVVIWAIFSSSYGEIRSYVFIGFMVGFYLHEKLLGRIASGVFRFLYKGISSFFKKTNSILALPIKMVYSLIKRCCCSLTHMLVKKKTRLRKILGLPKQIIYDSKKYYGLIVKRKGRKNSGNKGFS